MAGSFGSLRNSGHNKRLRIGVLKVLLMSHLIPIIPETPERLVVLDSCNGRVEASFVVEVLRRDCVILIRGITPERADNTLHDIAEALNLLDSLQVQAAYAEFLGHRQRIGQYRMTVNRRGDYQFISPHSEGDSFTNMQLASFYCFENATDGGETLLMNVDGSSQVWKSLRERTTRIAPDSRLLTPAELKRASVIYHLHSPPGLADGDLILGPRECTIPGLKLVDVLAKARTTRSTILERDLYAYWHTAEIVDRDSLRAYVSLLRSCNLLREPKGGLELRRMDNVAEHRIWSSGIDYTRLFRCKITYKLRPRDLLLLNNVTWTHAVSNWSPGSGVRSVSAAFA